jgi:hypothetical protein
MAAPSPAPRGGSSGIIPAQWPAQAADTIVDTIAKVRDRTTKPAIVAARALVYGLLAGIVGAVALILLLVLIVRIWDNYVPGHVWIIYAAFAVIFSVGGLVLLRKANAPAPADPDA